MRLFGLIGYPLDHSFSKKYFTEKFEKEGIQDVAYELFPIKNIDEIRDLLHMHPHLKGLNVTVPYKKLVLPFLDARNIPGELVACNCIKIKNGQLTGYNTDVIGFEKSLLPLLKTHHTKALILGNGGAAAAVRYVLKRLSISFIMVSRQPQNDVLTYDQLTANVIEEHSLIINTTPLGTFPGIEEYPSIPYHLLTDKYLLYDLVYNPEKTLFLQKGEAQGAAIKNGQEMLVLQAEESWRIWNEEEV